MVGVAAVLAVGWPWVVARRGLRAEFGESNYTANRIRMEEYLVRPSAPHHVLVGSSLSGRLRESFFAGTPMADIASLGLDGSVPLVGLEVLERRRDLPEVVWVETYLMEMDGGANGRALLEGLDSVGTRWALAWGAVRASVRPSSVLYTQVKERKDGSATRPTWTTNAVAGDGEPVTPGVTDPELENRWRRVVERFQKRGVRVMLVDLPSGEVRRPGRRTRPDLGDRLVQEFGLTRVDLREDWFGRGWVPRYTDGRHLDAASARETARMLAARWK